MGSELTLLRGRGVALWGSLGQVGTLGRRAEGEPSRGEVDQGVPGQLAAPAPAQAAGRRSRRGCAASRNEAISSRVASRLGARSTAAARALTSTAPRGPSTSIRCCSSGEGGGATGGGGAFSPSRSAARRPRRRRRGCGRAGRARFSSAAREERAAVGHLDEGAVGDHPRGGLVAPGRLALAPGGEGDEDGAVLGVQPAAALHPAPGRLGVGQQLGARAVAALVLLGDPLGAAERRGPAGQLVGELQQVDHVAGRVLELGGRQRAGGSSRCSARPCRASPRGPARAASPGPGRRPGRRSRR